MSAVIGNLRVNLGLDSAQFERGSKKAQQESDRLRTALSGIGTAAVASAAAIGGAAVAAGLGALTVGAIQEAQKFETQMKTVQAVIDATGGAAGRSASQLREQAREIAWSTLESTEGILKAQQTLLTFRNVQGEVFDRTIEAAADMSAALGGDLNTAALQLGRALEDPINSLSLLGRNGAISRDFIQANEDQIDAMVRSGNIAQAQALILDELAKMYGGTAEAAAQGLAGAQDTLGQAFQELKLEVADTFNLLERATAVNLTVANAVQALTVNFDRLVAIGGTVAAVFGGRIIAGFVAARVATMGLSGALVFLRGALIRTGIGALVVGAGELVYQFSRLAAGAGGFGEALGLLQNVSAEVWQRYVMGVTAATHATTAMFLEFKADAAIGMQGAVESVVAFGNAAVNTFEGAFNAIKAIWGALPAAIGDLVFQAANSLIDGVESMLNGVIGRFNSFLDGINRGLEALGSARRISIMPEIELVGIENRFEGAAEVASTAAKDAFDRAFQDDALSVPDFGFAEMAQEAIRSADVYSDLAQTMMTAARSPLTSWQALRDAMRNADEVGEDALSGATSAANSFDAAIGEAGESADEAADRMEKAVSALKDFAGRASGGISFRLPGIEDLEERFGNLTAQAREQLQIQQQIAAIEASRGIDAAVAGAAGLRSELTLTAEQQERFNALLAEASVNTSFAEASKDVAELTRFIIQSQGGLEGLSAEALVMVSSLSQVSLEGAEWATTVQEGASAAVGDVKMLAAALADAGTTQQQVANSLQSLGFEATTESVREFQREVGAAVDGIVGPETLGKIESELAKVGDAAKGAATEVAAGAAEAAGAASDAVQGEVASAQASGEAVGSATVEGLKTGIADAPQSMSGPVGQGISAVSGMAGEARSAGASIGQNIAAGIRSSIDAARPAVEAAARSLARTAVDAMNAALDIQSPSRETYRVGEYAGEGFADGLEAMESHAETAARAVTGAARDAMAEGENEFMSVGKSLVEGLLGGMSSGNIMGGLSGFLGQARQSFMGAPMVQGLMGSIGSFLAPAMPIIGGISTAMNLISGFRSEKVLDKKLQGAFGFGDAFAGTKTTKEVSSFWGLFKNKRTSFKQSAEETEAVREMGSEMRRALAEAGDAFGLSAKDLRGVRVEFSKDMRAGAEAYGEALDAVAMKTVPGLERFAQAGESAGQAMQRAAALIDTFNSSARVMRLPELPETIAGAQDANRILARAGGASAFSSNMNAVFGMLDPKEQARELVIRLRKQMRELGFQGDVFKLDTAEELTAAMTRAREAGNIGTFARLSQLAPIVQQLASARDARDREREQASSVESRRSDDLTRQEIDVLRARGLDDRAFELELSLMEDYLRPGARLLRDLRLEEEARNQATRDAEEAARNAQRAEEDLARSREQLSREVAGYQGFSTFRQEQIAAALAMRAEESDTLKEVLDNLWATMRQVAANTGRQADDTSILVAQGAE